MKQTVVTIKNNDSLCCARVIDTAKVKVDGHPNWGSFKDGRFKLIQPLNFMLKLTFRSFHVAAKN